MNNHNDFYLKIEMDDIESKDQFLVFIDVILSHPFVKEYDDKGIIDYLVKKFSLEHLNEQEGKNDSKNSN